MSSKTVSYSTWIISIVVAIIIAILVYANIGRIFSPTIKELPYAEQYNIAVGDALTLTGVIAADGDLRFYTHTIQTQEYGRVGLKSRSNLNSYKGPVQLQGTIESILNDQQLFVLSVDSVILLPEQETEAVDIVSAAQYNRAAGIHFPVAFFDIYDGIDTSKAGTITITQGENTYTIQYFRCTTDKSDTDCFYLQNSFATTASKVFTTVDGMTFYKMSEADSRYTHNDGLMGYFFNDIAESALLTLSRNIDFPTIKSVEQRVLPHVSRLCTDGSVAMAGADDYALLVKTSAIHLAITGAVGTQVANCELVIDYTQTYNAIRTQFVVQQSAEPEPTPEQQESQPNPPVSTTPVIRPTPFDTSVQQFPINLERPFVFTSSRGHTITFPSQNIAFGAVEFDENPLLVGNGCYAQQNLVSYANKPVLQSEPSVIIYECRRAIEEGLPQQYIAYPLEEGKNFVVYVLQGARRDFANNIIIK